MSVPDDILRAVRREIDWVNEGPSTGDIRVLTQDAGDWSKISWPEIKMRERSAAVLDGEMLFDHDLDRLTEPGFIQGRNPRYLAVRAVMDDRIRWSFVFIRSRLCPSQEDLNALAYLP